MNENTTTDTPARTGVPALIDQMRGRREARREARERVRHLERELACYTSQADIDDLEATLARYDDEDTELVRSILSRQRSRVA